MPSDGQDSAPFEQQSRMIVRLLRHEDSVKAKMTDGWIKEAEALMCQWGGGVCRVPVVSESHSTGL
jgi:hypothetical protein